MSQGGIKSESDSPGEGSAGNAGGNYSQILRRIRTKVPKTARGRRTRDKVLASAREIFAADGYAGTRVTDITEHAGIALGSFYSYFDDKGDVLAALLEPVFEELYEATRAPYLDTDDPEAVLRTSVHAYMSVYHANADLMRTLMEATTVDEPFANLWFEIRAHFLQRIVRNIELAQRSGLATPMNPVIEGSALGGMLENACWIWFAMGGERSGGKPMLEEVDFDEVVAVVTKLWVSALFNVPPGSAAPESDD